MRHIICPTCGEVKQYGIVETVARMLLFDANGNEINATEDRTVYSGTTKRCLCGKIVKIVEDGDPDG